MKKLVFALVLALIPVIGSAQTTTKTETLAWDYLEDTLANVQTYNQKVTVNGTLLTVVPLCVQMGVNVTCQAPVVVNANASNTIKVAATKNGVEKAVSFTGINPALGPKDAANPRLQINVTVNFGVTPPERN